MEKIEEQKTAKMQSLEKARLKRAEKLKKKEDELAALISELEGSLRIGEVAYSPNKKFKYCVLSPSKRLVFFGALSKKVRKDSCPVQSELPIYERYPFAVADVKQLGELTEKRALVELKKIEKKKNQENVLCTDPEAEEYYVKEFFF